MRYTYKAEIHQDRVLTTVETTDFDFLKKIIDMQFKIAHRGMIYIYTDNNDLEIEDFDVDTSMDYYSMVIVKGEFAIEKTRVFKPKII